MVQANVVITEYKNRICALCFRQNHFEELHVQTQNSMLNSIYIAKVKNIRPNINAAFVELLDGQMAFLPLDDTIDCPFIPSPDGRLREGDEIPVQVIKEAVKTKDPVVTTKLSINGAYTVVSLDKHKGGFQFSKKLTNEQKNKIKASLTDITIEDTNMIPDTYAVVIRTGAGELDDYMPLAEELRALTAQMDEIILRAKTRTCFSCIYQGSPSYIEYLHHISDFGYEEVVTDIAHVYNELTSCYKGAMPIRFYKDAFPLKKLYSIETKMDELFMRHIYLKSGGSIVIDYTEAMTVIDVNTGKCITRKNKDTLNYQINLEAAAEIARQIRLRNLSGIIIVDFINMENKEYEQKLIKELKQLLKQDSVLCSFADITSLGLVEITRKKIKKPIYEIFK